MGSSSSNECSTLFNDENTITITPKTELSTAITRISTITTTTPSEADFDILFKIVVAGSSGVGKSCFLSRAVNDHYSSDFLTTIGVDFKLIRATVDDVRVKLQFWDTAGQSAYRGITESYFRNANLVCVCIDLANSKSLEFLEYFSNVWRKYDFFPFIVIGTKSDVLKREVTREEIVKYLKNLLGAESNYTYLEISSLQGKGIYQVIQHINEMAVKEFREQQEQERDHQVSSDVATTTTTTTATTTSTTNNSNFASLSPFPKRIIVQKRKCVKRDQNYTKANIVLLTSSKGLMYGGEKGFWEKLFPSVLTINDRTSFKIDENQLKVEIDNVKLPALYLYLPTRPALDSFVKEWKQVYGNSKFDNVNFKLEEISKVYKIRCNILGVSPSPDIIHLLDDLYYENDTIISDTCNLRGMMLKMTLKQKKAIFSTVIWMSNITTLDFGNNNLNDQDVEELCFQLEGLNHFTTLNLSNNTELTRNSCFSLVNTLMKRDSLRMLSMSGCSNIMNDGAISLLSCNSIDVIDLSRCGLGNIIAEKINALSKNQDCNLKEVRLMMNNINAEKLIKQSTIKLDILEAITQKLDESIIVSNESIVVEQHKMTVIDSSPNTNKILDHQSDDIVIKNRYKLERRIGKGGFGTVYLAFDQIKNYHVALKSIEFDDLRDLEKAFDEISHHQKLTHEHIVNIIDFTMSARDMKLYLILPYYEHGDLQRIITDQKRLKQPIDEKIICSFLLQSAQSLEYILENHNLIHCDIKPANFLIKNFSNKCKVIESALNDFGLSLQVSSKSRLVSEVGMSPIYSPPETIEGKGTNYKSDIFSLGVTLLEMMSFTNTCIWKLYMSRDSSEISETNVVEDRDELVKKFLRKSVESNFSYNSILVDIVLQMVSYRPEDRPDYSSIISRVSSINVNCSTTTTTTTITSSESD